MKASERRGTTRFNLRIPLRFRPIVPLAAAEQKVESLNISERGVYFATEHPPPVGTVLELFLELVDEISGHPATQLRHTGRVVHVQPNAHPPQRSGVGVQFDSFEVLTAAERRKR